MLSNLNASFLLVSLFLIYPRQTLSIPDNSHTFFMYRLNFCWDILYEAQGKLSQLYICQ